MQKKLDSLNHQNKVLNQVLQETNSELKFRISDHSTTLEKVNSENQKLEIDIEILQSEKI